MRQTPAGFCWQHEGADSVLVRAEVRAELGPILRQFLDGTLAMPATQLAGGRGGARVVELSGGVRVVLRRNWRGGLPARVLRDIYFGCRPRPFAEVVAAHELRQRGVRVPEVLGAVVRRVGPCCYRGAVATREVGDSSTLWDYLARTPSIAERRHAVTAALAAVDRLVAVQAVHPDLNLRNFLVVGQQQPLQIWIIDCDGVRFARFHPWGRWRAQRRLQRSARKLDPPGAVVDPSWFADGASA